MAMQGFEESQAGESPVIRALLPDDPVVYVDVGCADYADWNVTWPYYKAGGYGLIIEPREEVWPELIQERPRDVLYTGLVWYREECLDFRLADCCSTVREDWVIDHLYKGIKRIRAEKLSTILQRHPSIRDQCRLCSIDVEGCERQALLGIDWETFQPDVIIIEFVRYHRTIVGEDLSAEWDPILTDSGMYSLCCQSWLNKIYIRPHLRARWEAIRHTTPLPHATLAETRAYYAQRYGI